MVNILGNSFSLPSWLVIVGFYLAWVAMLLFVKKVGFLIFRRFASRTKTNLDDIFFESANLPIYLLILGSGGFAVVKFLPEPAAEAFFKGFLPLFKAVAILAAILFINKFFIGLMKEYASRVEILRDTAGIVHGIIRAVVFGLGALILLDSFGVSITPIIASLGISSLAIALALQPTLENLFAGIQLVMDKPIQVGHFIKLESGEEGYVERIGWRTTWIRLPPNNVIILQNKNLGNSKILNYYYPDQETAVPIDLGVHYESDLEKVEKVTLEVARQVLREIPVGVADFEPGLLYHTLGDFSIHFTVVLRVREVTKSGLLRHEFLKRIHKRYAKEGIVIPYPVQAVNYTQEKMDPALAKKD